MKKKLIYTPSGRAGEYANHGYAANLFNGCVHGCRYCYVPGCKRLKADVFHRSMHPAKDVLQRLRMDMNTKLSEPLFLSFTCDPYPPDDTFCGITRQAIRIVLDAGNAVNILTKGGLRAVRDFDLLARDSRNRIGATLTFLDKRASQEWEPLASAPRDRIEMLSRAKDAGISTWASLEPVINPRQTLRLIVEAAPFVDVFKIGKWNHDKRAGEIDWKEFYHEAKTLLDELGCRYVFKKDLLDAVGKA